LARAHLARAHLAWAQMTWGAFGLGADDGAQLTVRSCLRTNGSGAVVGRN
jgi:hypothetical protein